MQENEKNLFRTARGYQLTMQGGRELSSSMEDYLEMIGRLWQNGGPVRIGALAAALQIKPSSASKMVAKLRQLGYVKPSGGESVLLTAAGRGQARFLLRRHLACERLLGLLGSPAPLHDAELLEHAFTPQTLGKLEAAGLIQPAGQSERKKFYDITPAGRRLLREEA